MGDCWLKTESFRNNASFYYIDVYCNWLILLLFFLIFRWGPTSVPVRQVWTRMVPGGTCSTPRCKSRLPWTTQPSVCKWAQTRGPARYCSIFHKTCRSTMERCLRASCSVPPLASGMLRLVADCKLLIGPQQGNAITQSVWVRKHITCDTAESPKTWMFKLRNKCLFRRETSVYNNFGCSIIQESSSSRYTWI